MEEAARVAYLQRLDAEVLTADAELAELESALQPEEGCWSADDIPELGWARACCESLRGWVELLQRLDPSAPEARIGSPLHSAAREQMLQARTEHARGELLRARLLVNERITLLRQASAFRHEAQLRLLEEVHLRAEAAAALAPRPDRTLLVSLAWLRCELHAAWRLMEAVLQAEDRDWARARRDFERALASLSRSAQRLASGQPAPGLTRIA
jgi:hypothetical protein